MRSAVVVRVVAVVVRDRRILDGQFLCVWGVCDSQRCGGRRVGDGQSRLSGLCLKPSVSSTTNYAKRPGPLGSIRP